MSCPSGSDVGLDREAIVQLERHLLIVPEFFERAGELRATFEQRFDSPRRTTRERFVWDYWHISGQYTYLRTPAPAYFPAELWSSFWKRLRSWGEAHLGCASATDPWLSFYVGGCRQELHTDVPHGPWAFVFSLTRWDERTFTGGETIMLRPSSLDDWAAVERSDSRELGAFVERVPAAFNQLTVFDPRIPHGVAPVEGTWNPLQSRLVIHGWFKEPRLHAEGAIDVEAAARAIDEARGPLAAKLGALPAAAGLVVLRLSVSPDGGQEVGVVSETLVSQTDDATGRSSVLEAVMSSVSDLELNANGAGSLFVPIRLPLA